MSESIFRELKAKWATKGYGLDVATEDGERMTNLRFADDVLLVAKTFAEVKAMILDLSLSAGRVGVKLHPGKTKILSNVPKRKGEEARGIASIGDMQVEIFVFE